MAIKNIGRSPYTQYLVGLSNDQKPINANYSHIGDRFYETDTGKEFVFDGENWVLQYGNAASIGIPTDIGITDPTKPANIIALLKGILSKTSETIINADEINLNTDELETLVSNVVTESGNIKDIVSSIRDINGIKKIVDTVSTKVVDSTDTPISADNPLPIQGSVSASVSGNVSIADSSIANAAAVTPDDNTDLATPSTWLYIGVSGDLEVILTGGQTVIFRNLAVGFYPICATRIKASGTTALNIIAGW
jgi:hypothetical protein